MVSLVSCGSNPGTETPPAQGSNTNPAPASPTQNPASEGQNPVEAMRAFSAAFTARPEHSDPQVVVQHLLVAFAGSGVPKATRTKKQAEELAAEIWKRIQNGGDFDALVQKHTDDSYPGRYTMVNSGNPPAGAYRRSGMVPAFGNTGWRLAVGEYGLAAYDPQASPFGWHIVKRLQ
jgi:PPIC-type PPIASE domain